MARAALRPMDHPPSTELPTTDAGSSPTQHTVVVRVADGMDGALRVALMLRGRRYLVSELVVDVRDGEPCSTLRATVALTPAELDLLLERLRRMPVVVCAGEL